MLLGFLVALSLPGAYGQKTSVSCSTAYDWMRNSEGQNPCLITAWLQYPCVGSYDVGQPTYVGPMYEDAKPCTCNTVLYSTLAACAVCQGVGLGGIVPWSAFSQHCPSVARQQYPEPVPNDTSIPSWAYIPFLNDTFDVKAAQILALLGPTESTGTLTNHTTLSQPIETSPSTPTSDATHLAGGSTLVGQMVGDMLLLSMAITSIVISARKLRDFSVPPQTSPLMMTPSPPRTPLLHMPNLRIPALRMPALKLRMPALLRTPTWLRALRLPVFKLRVPTWQKRSHDSEASWVIGAPSTYGVLNDPDDPDPPAFPELPSPADVYCYRCHKKALDVMPGCERPGSFTDVSMTSTVGTVESYSPLTVPLRGYGYHWRSKCATV